MRKGAKGINRVTWSSRRLSITLLVPVCHREGLWERSGALVSCPPPGKSLRILLFSDGFTASSVGLTQTPFGMDGAVFNFMPLDLSDGSHFDVSNGNSC